MTNDNIKLKRNMEKKGMAFVIRDFNEGPSFQRFLLLLIYNYFF